MFIHIIKAGNIYIGILIIFCCWIIVLCWCISSGLLLEEGFCQPPSLDLMDEDINSNRNINPNTVNRQNRMYDPVRDCQKESSQNNGQKRKYDEFWVSQNENSQNNKQTNFSDQNNQKLSDVRSQVPWKEDEVSKHLRIRDKALKSRINHSKEKIFTLMNQIENKKNLNKLSKLYNDFDQLRSDLIHQRVAFIRRNPFFQTISKQTNYVIQMDYALEYSYNWRRRLKR